MRIQQAGLVILGALLGAAGIKAQQSVPQAFDPSSSDVRAIQVADQLAQALGGMDAWRRARFLRYDWVAVRGQTVRTFQHLWDKHTGRYRLEGENEGKSVTVLFNVNSREGTAYVDGQPAAGEDAKKWVDFAYRRFINDGYWFYMPFKWKDPGVHLQYEGEEEIEGKAYDVVRLTYDQVGLTPDDIFWGYVNQQTHRMDQWAYVLKGRKEPRTFVKWSGWRKYDGLQFASERIYPEDPDRKIVFRNMGVYAEVEDRYFTSPEAKLSGLPAGQQIQ